MILIRSFSRHLQGKKEECGKSVVKASSIFNTDNTTYHIKLRNCRPLREIFHTLPDRLICQNINRMEIQIKTLKYLTRRVRKSALREKLRTLHKQQYRMIIDQLLDSLFRIFRCFLSKTIIEATKQRGRGRGRRRRKFLHATISTTSGTRSGCEGNSHLDENRQSHSKNDGS